MKCFLYKKLKTGLALFLGLTVFMTGLSENYFYTQNILEEIPEERSEESRIEIIFQAGKEIFTDRINTLVIFRQRPTRICNQLYKSLTIPKEIITLSRRWRI